MSDEGGDGSTGSVDEEAIIAGSVIVGICLCLCVTVCFFWRRRGKLAAVDRRPPTFYPTPIHQTEFVYTNEQIPWPSRRELIIGDATPSGSSSPYYYELSTNMDDGMPVVRRLSPMTSENLSETTGTCSLVRIHNQPPILQPISSSDIGDRYDSQRLFNVENYSPMRDHRDKSFNFERPRRPQSRRSSEEAQSKREFEESDTSRIISQSVLHMRYPQSRSRTGYSSKATSASGHITIISESLRPVGDISADDYSEEEELKPYREIEESESGTTPQNWHHNGRRSRPGEKSSAVKNIEDGCYYKNSSHLGIPIRHRSRGSVTKTDNQQLSSEYEELNQNTRASGNLRASKNDLGNLKGELRFEKKEVTKLLTQNANRSLRGSLRIIHDSRPIGTVQSRQRVPNPRERPSEDSGQDSVYPDEKRDKPRMIPKIVRAWR